MTKDSSETKKVHRIAPKVTPAGGLRFKAGPFGVLTCLFTTFFPMMNFRFFPTLLVSATLLALPGCNQKEFAALQQQNAELTKSRDQLALEKSVLAADKTRSEATLSPIPYYRQLGQVQV